MSFFTDFLIKSPLYTTTSLVKSLDYLDPITRIAVIHILEESAAAGTPLLLFETFRSEARQQQLYTHGATQLETVGVHNFGLAADLVKNVGGSPSWKGDFSFLGVLAKKHGLIWGGDWGRPDLKHGFIDACHVQRCAVSDQPKLFDRSWYPGSEYQPHGTD